MKKNSKIALWTVLAGGLLAIPRQAHAAHWELTYKINGQIRHMPYGGQVEEKAWSELYPGDPTTGEIQDCERPALQIDSPGYARNGESIGYDWYYKKADFVEDVTTVVGAGASIAGNVLEGPVLGGLAAFVGIAASEIGEVENNHASGNFDACWTDSRSTFDDPPTSGLTSAALELEQDDYRMVPVKLIGYTTIFAKADKYGAHGFLGIGHKNVRKYDGRSATIGAFTRVGGGDNGNG